MIVKYDNENLENLEVLFPNLSVIIEDMRVNPFAKLYVFLKEDVILGYLYYSEIYDRIEINQIEVYEAFRSRGIAMSLMKQLILNGKDITLEVREDNFSAIKLYKKFGFKKVAIREKYYNDKDGILMERKYVIK